MPNRQLMVVFITVLLQLFFKILEDGAPEMRGAYLFIFLSTHDYRLVNGNFIPTEFFYVRCAILSAGAV
jgi:hypothetical protein